MGTSVNHLFVRGTTYWWKRRLPRPVRDGFPACVARSLQTRDPALARRLGRACSAAFDSAILSVMSDSSVTREDLKRVLDDIFQRILGEGERERADREPGPPPWTPEPQEDPRYEHLEPEEWDQVPSPPEQWTQDWRDAVTMNAQDDVRPLLDDALERRRLEMPRDTGEWRRLSRLALIVAAQAHAINCRREHADYSDGWPASAGIPLEAMPSQPGERQAPTVAHPVATTVAKPTLVSATPVATTPVPTLSESFEEFTRLDPRWNSKTRQQATVAIRKFVSLMGDLPVNEVRQAVVEEFRARLHKVPNLFGKSMYKGQSAFDAMTAAERLRTVIAGTPGPGPVSWHKGSVPREEAVRRAAPTSMKTVNRDFSFFTSWGKWMENNDERRALLHGQKCPFAGRAFSKKQTRTEMLRGGRKRRQFTSKELATLLSAPLFREPFELQPSQDPATRLQQAYFWSVLIGLHAGLRLGEIAQLRPGDVDVEDDVPCIRLRSDGSQELKSEAGDRVVPLHPTLVSLGLLEFARAMAEAGSDMLLPGFRVWGDQHGGNVSRWFTDFRREQGVDSRQTVFHSFRHCFVSAIRSRRGTDEVLIDQIVGHDEYNSVRHIYSGELPVGLKAEAVAHIDYKIDLSHIFAWVRAR